MHELARFEPVSADDVSAVRRLTRDVARLAGLADLEQTKLATVASELARHAVAVAGRAMVVFGLDDPGGACRLVVTVSDAGPPAGLEPAERTPPPARSPWDRSGEPPEPDDRALRRLVDSFAVDELPHGGRRAEAAVRLPADTPASDPAGLARRAAALRPKVSPETLERRNLELADALALLEAQSGELEWTNTELETVNAALAAVNQELELTNRGVLSLNAELEQRAEHLAASEARHRQLADQQAALATLGRSAVSSRDPEALARQVVATLHDVLEAPGCALWRFLPGKRRLRLVAHHGCEAGAVPPVRLGARQFRQLCMGRTVSDDLATGPAFPFPVPAAARSAAAVVIPTPGVPWGVLAACHTEPDRFGGTTMAFLEAAASLLASSINRTALEDSARHAALHDALTSLPNRASLLDDLGRLLDRRRQGPSPAGADGGVAVLFVDLDGFKGVNDTLGHAAGDEVLVETARRLSRRLRPSDTLARLGGDEFVAVCGDVDEVAAAQVARRLLAAFDDPFLFAGGEVFLSASIGISLTRAGVTAEQALADADLAMYRAKRTSGPTSAAYDPEMRNRAEAESRLHSELRRAEERGQLRAVYQPLVDLADGTVRSVEALIRWRHPDLGDVPADRTVAAAERIGLVWDLTRFVLTEAGRTIATWNAAHPAHVPLRLSVNFTPLLLDDAQRIEELEAVITAAGFPLGLLDVELTETALARPTATVLDAIGELHRRGARLAMDDFGTGYSSLVSLMNLPFDVVKIDRSFVAPLDRGGDTLLVSAITGIGRGRRLETVGEGIETDGQLAALIAAECDLGQGYLFAKPLEAAELGALTGLEEGCARTVRRARLAAVDGPLPLRRNRSATRRPARILVVEDNPADLELLRALLGSAGHEIAAVEDPATFVAALQENQPDLVLMDLRLRGTDGFALVEQAEPFLTMPVVAVTGYPQWVLDRDDRAGQFSGVISKPVDPASFLARVDCLLAVGAGDRPAGAA